MAAVFFEGFDYYSSSLPLNSRWLIAEAGSPGIVSLQPGRYLNSQSMNMASNQNGVSSTAEILIGQSLTNFSCGFSIRISGTPVAHDMLSFISTVSEGTNLRLRMNSANRDLQLLTGATVLGTTATGALPLDTWVYIEIECEQHSTTGSAKLYIDGTQVINAISVPLPASGDATIGLIRFASGQHQLSYRVDDLYVSDTSTKLGESRVIVITPDADTAQINFQTVPPTGLAGNFDAVNGLTVDNTDWVYGGTTGWKDVYEIENMSFNPAQIHGIQPIYVARKDDTADMNVRVNVISGASTINGPTNNLAFSTTDWYSYYDPIIYNNPVTGLPWKAGDINSLRMGPEIL